MRFAKMPPSHMKFLWPRLAEPLDSLCPWARQIRFTIEGTLMLDVILIAVGGGLFFLAMAYAYACDRL
jgi:hypothetical protein